MLINFIVEIIMFFDLYGDFIVFFIFLCVLLYHIVRFIFNIDRLFFLNLCFYAYRELLLYMRYFKYLHVRFNKCFYKCANWYLKHLYKDIKWIFKYFNKFLKKFSNKFPNNKYLNIYISKRRKKRYNKYRSRHFIKYNSKYYGKYKYIKWFVKYFNRYLNMLIQYFNRKYRKYRKYRK